MWDETSVSITVCDNGYVVDWRKPEPEQDPFSGAAFIYPGPPRPKTSGKKIFDTKAKLLKWLKEEML